MFSLISPKIIFQVMLNANERAEIAEINYCTFRSVVVRFDGICSDNSVLSENFIPELKNVVRAQHFAKKCGTVEMFCG